MTTVVTDTCANMPPELTEVLQIEIVPYNPWGQSLVVALGSTGGGSCRNGTRAQRDAGATGQVQDLPLRRWWRATTGRNVRVSPYCIHRGNETLRDLVDISRQEFHEWLSAARELPTTANPGPGDYLQAFERVSERTSEIVAGTLKSKGSGAYQSACLTREMATACHVCQTGCTLMTADTLQYLRRGGRIDRARRLVTTLYNIKPIISKQEGITVAAG